MLPTLDPHHWHATNIVHSLLAADCTLGEVIGTLLASDAPKSNGTSRHKDCGTLVMTIVYPASVTYLENHSTNLEDIYSQYL